VKEFFKYNRRKNSKYAVMKVSICENIVDIHYFQQTLEHLMAVCRIDKHFGPRPSSKLAVPQDQYKYQ